MKRRNHHLSQLQASLLAIAVGAGATSAHAAPRDPAAAQALFDEAMTLMKTRAFDKACPKLAESQRLDPGIGTQFRLAECYEGEGLIASAWAQYLEVASVATASGQTDRAKAARRRAEKLEPRLSKIKITVAKRVPGLKLERDGVAVGEASLGSPLPVDPGEHEIAVSAPGYRAFTDKLTSQEGRTTELMVPELQPEPESKPNATTAAAPLQAPLPPPQPTAAPSAVVPSAASPVEVTPPSSGLGPFVIGLGVVGIAGIGVGSVLGIMANAKYSDSKTHCPTDVNHCDGAGVKLRDDSIGLANGSTIAFVAGGASLAGAAIVLLTRGPSKAGPGVAASFSPAPSGGRVVVEGRF